jgi:hypothetical protein
VGAGGPWLAEALGRAPEHGQLILSQSFR